MSVILMAGELPESVTSIGESCFKDCVNMEIDLSKTSITSIPQYIFDGCQNIHEMVIPTNVTYIANSSFTGAKQDEIDVSQNEYAQSLIGGLPAKGAKFTVEHVVYQVVNSSEQNGTVAAVSVDSKKVKSIVVADTVMRGGYTFKVTEIGKNAFKGIKKNAVVKVSKKKYVKKYKKLFKSSTGWKRTMRLKN